MMKALHLSSYILFFRGNAIVYSGVLCSKLEKCRGLFIYFTIWTEASFSCFNDLNVYHFNGTGYVCFRIQNSPGLTTYFPRQNL